MEFISLFGWMRSTIKLKEASQIVIKIVYNIMGVNKRGLQGSSGYGCRWTWWSPVLVRGVALYIHYAAGHGGDTRSLVLIISKVLRRLSKQLSQLQMCRLLWPIRSVIPKIVFLVKIAGNSFGIWEHLLIGSSGTDWCGYGTVRREMGKNIQRLSSAGK